MSKGSLSPQRTRSQFTTALWTFLHLSVDCFGSMHKKGLINPRGHSSGEHRRAFSGLRALCSHQELVKTSTELRERRESEFWTSIHQMAGKTRRFNAALCLLDLNSLQTCLPDELCKVNIYQCCVSSFMHGHKEAKKISSYRFKEKL